MEVFKIVKNYYDLDAAVKLSFNAFSTTRGNKYKLQKFTCHYSPHFTRGCIGFALCVCQYHSDDLD